MTPRRGRYFVEALGRGLAVLDCFIEAPRAHSLIELSRQVGLGMPSTLRLVRTLEEAGYVRQDPQTRRYTLSWKMLQLQDLTHSILDYAEVARPHLEALATNLGEDTGMAVLEGTDVRHAVRVSASRIVSANVRPGSWYPAHATAMGKVLLAGQDESLVHELATRRPFDRFTPTTITTVDELLDELSSVARQGYAVSNQEWEPGLRSLAAPVRVRDGRVVAAVCVIVVRPDVTLSTMRRDFLPALLQAADSISSELGFRGADDEPRVCLE